MPSSLEGQELAGGAVRVPIGALGDGSDREAVVATVVVWAGAGPLFHVKERSPAGRDGAMLRSTLLSVTFEASGVELQVRGSA